MYTVYKISNSINDFCYYGVSSQVKRRWINHKYHIKRKSHENKRIRDFSKIHKIECFNFEKLYEGTKKSAEEIEESLIRINYAKTWNSSIGKKHNGEWKLNNSIKISGSKNGMWGRTHSDEVKKYCRFINTGENSWKSNTILHFNENDVLVNTYGSAREAERETGIGRNIINKTCKSHDNFYKGFYFRYQ